MNVLRIFLVLIVLSCLSSCSLCVDIISAPVKVFTNEEKAEEIKDERSLWEKTKGKFKWFYGVEEKEEKEEKEEENKDTKEKEGIFRRVGGSISKLFYWGTVGH